MSRRLGLELIGGNRVTGGGRIEKFHQPLVIFLMPSNYIGLEIFPSLASTRRQAIHSLDFFVLLYQDKRTYKM